MSENVNNFINAVNQQDYTTAKDHFQAAMAQKVNDAFENKKIELAKNMTEDTNRDNTESIDSVVESLSEGMDIDPRKLAKIIDGMSTDLVKNNVDSAVSKLDQMIDNNKEKADFLKMIIPAMDLKPDAERKLQAKMKEYSKG